MKLFIQKIQRKLLHLRLRPIRVFCLHHVCETFDVDSMYECDWMQIDEFKSKILTMQLDGVEFISLSEAYKHICNDWFRRKKYAVLTFDDGWSTIKSIIPWLCEEHIPVALFVNPSYLIGEEKREKGISLTLREMEKLLELGGEYVQIASHGWNHRLCAEMKMSEFEENVNQCESFFYQYNKSYIPFFAYPCGQNTSRQNKYLLSKRIIPVLMDDAKNYNDTLAIHRELLA